jgi:hypothetical protein
VRKVRLSRIANREQVEMPLGAGEMEARRQGAPVFALVRAGAALHHAVDDGYSLKMRIVGVGGLRIIALGARLETDGQKLSVAALFNPAGELAGEALAALTLSPTFLPIS